VEVDKLGHIVDASKIALRVPWQDLPTVYYSLPNGQTDPATKLAIRRTPRLQCTQRGLEIETVGCLGRCALTLTPVDRTTETEDGEDGEAGEETTSASAQARSGCSTHTAVPGRKIIAAAAS